MRPWLALVTLAACGRVGFSPARGDGHGASPGDGGGPGGDAAWGDAPRADDAPGANDAPSACATAEICDGFEAPTIAPIWSASPGVMLDTTVAHRGGSSIHVHTGAINAGEEVYATLLEQETAAAGMPGTFWVRAWVRLEDLPAGTNGMELFAAEQPSSSASNGDYVFLHAGDAALYSQFSNAYRATTAPPPLDTWFCVDWKVVRSTGSGGSLAMTSDVLSSLALPGATDGMPPIDGVALGIGFSSTNVEVAQPAVDLWIDDVLVSFTPVTCAD